VASPLRLAPPSLVIFDCDGVLVDSETLQTELLLELAGELGFSLPRTEALDRFRGANLTDVVSLIEAQIGRPTPEDFVPVMRKRQAELFTRELRAVDGIHEALAALPGLPRCVASSGPVAKIRLSLALTGLTDAFGEHIFSGYDIGSWKPAPDLFLHAAARMGASAAGCVVVEDSVIGVQAAVAARMRVLGFAGIEASRGRALAEAGAHVFTDMRALPALVLPHTG
jgi:HAD superfamily hydrolase (TIGR01509 family)